MKAVSIAASSRPRGITQGIVKALPIVVGYFPLGVPFGVLASQQGISLVAAVVMSATVIGSVQFVALSLLAAGEPLLGVIVTTFVINLRYLVMTSALVPYVRQWPFVTRLLFSLGMTDDLFALHSTEFAAQKGSPKIAPAIASNLTAQLSWVAATLVGYLLGSVLADIRPLGLDFTLTAMFLAFLVSQVTSRRAFAIAVLCAFLALLLLPFGRLVSLLVPVVVGSLLGGGSETWTKE